MSYKTPLLLFLFLVLYSTNLLALSSNSYQSKRQDSTIYYEEKVSNPNSNDDLIKAFVFFRKAKEENLKVSNYTHAIYNLRQIAIIQNMLGAFYDSEKSAIEALKLVDNLKQDSSTIENRIGIYNQLGKIYRNLLEYDKALNYYRKALAIAQTESHKIILKSNIDYALLRSGKLEQSLASYKILIEAIETVSDSSEMARILHNYAIVKGKFQHADALSYFEQALEIRQKLHKTSDVIGSYMDISTYYLETGDILNAKHYARKAHTLAIETGIPNIISETFDLIIGLKTDPEVLLYKHIRDSIEKANLLTEGKYASKKYDLDKQEKRASENLLQAEKQKNLKLIYGYSAILLGVLAFVWFLITRHRHKKQKQLEVYNTELRISKKVHDEVANDVYHLMNKLQQKNIDRDAVLDDLESVYEKTRDISREYQNIDVAHNYQDLLKDLISNYQNSETNIIIKGLSKIKWDGLSEIKKVSIYRVLQELMTNMKKHSQASIVVLDFNQTGQKIHIQYTDNGAGCIIKKDNGLQNTENRIKTIKGSITFKSQINEGFSALIKV